MAQISPGFPTKKAHSTRNPYLFTATNANLIALFKLIGPSILRIGGNSVDRNTWTPSGAGQTAGPDRASDVNALAAFLAATGWKCLYGINLGGAGPNPYTSGSITAATTPALAAEEIAYVYQALGSSLFGFEIGNECDLYGSSYFSGATWNVSTFETLWSPVPRRHRGANASRRPALHGSGRRRQRILLDRPFRPMGDQEQHFASDPALLPRQWRRAASSTAANLITPDSSLVSNLATLKSGARASASPSGCTECNSYYNGGSSGVSNAYCSSLWVIDFLFNNAQGGSVGTNFHGGGNGDGYTPIADSDGAVVEARPEYYGILFFTLAGQGTLYTTSLSGIGSLNITAYAVKTSSGGLNIIIVNKDSAANLQLTIDLPQSATSATLLEMTQLTSGASGPDITATSGVTIQGASVGANGSFSAGAAYVLSPSGTQVMCYVPYYSAVLIQIP